MTAVISEERGSLTIDESIRIALNALADHSLTVRKTALQEIRNILHQHRAWLSGLLPATPATVSSKGNSQQTDLHCTLLGALLKCCDPEVGQQRPHCGSAVHMLQQFYCSNVECFPAQALQCHLPSACLSCI